MVDMTKVPAVLNAKFLKTIGEENASKWLVLDYGTYNARDNTELLGFNIQHDFHPYKSFFALNATNQSWLNQAGFRDTDDLIDRKLVLYLTKVLFGSEEVDAIRIREIIELKKSSKLREIIESKKPSKPTPTQVENVEA